MSKQGASHGGGELKPLLLAGEELNAEKGSRRRRLQKNSDDIQRHRI